MAKFQLDTEFVRQLAQILQESNLGEIELADGDKHIRVARPSVTMAAAPLAAPAAVAPAAAAAAPAPTAAEAGKHPGAVTSPMVGTAYLSPEPGASAFVKVGDTVKEGQTLMIVEAMKTMNHIPSPRSGTVKRILVEDGMPVEYGSALMIVE